MENSNFYYAGFWRRFAAVIIDQILMMAVQSILFTPLFFLFGFGAMGLNELGGADDYSNVINVMQYYDEGQYMALGFLVMIIVFIGTIISLVIQWLYYAIMESSSKQATLGKMALGIKVVDMQGGRIKFSRATGRYFGKMLSGMIINIGFIMAAFTSQKQALHDILANCLVIINKPHYDQFKEVQNENETIENNFVI